MPKLADEQDTISIVEAARRLNVEVNYVYALARSARLDARKSGRQWLVSAKAVAERRERLGASSNISSDDQFLYAGINGSSSVQRFTLPSLLPDIKYSLGADSLFGPQFAVDLGVAPELPHTTAVSRGVSNVSPYAFGGMAIYDDATPSATTAQGHGPLYDSLQWGSDTAIYANNSEVTSFDLYTLVVNSGGVVHSSQGQPSDLRSLCVSTD